MAIRAASTDRMISDASRADAIADAPQQADGSDRIAGRLGLSVPREWWSSDPLLKSYEAAGFAWVQLHSPPVSVLVDGRQAIRHAAIAGEALATTGLRAVVHAPGSLRAGTRDGDHGLGEALAYTADVGALQLVYHAQALPERLETVDALRAEADSLARLARCAERLEVTLAIENLAPLYPEPESMSAHPLTLRSLVERIDSEAVALCLDVGHAHVIADLRHTTVDYLCEPVIDRISVFHVHDNLGARRGEAGGEAGLDPLRLDLHLPPGRGTLPWGRIGPLLAGHDAPLVLEVHPPHCPPAAELATSAARLIAPPAGGGRRDRLRPTPADPQSPCG